MAPVQGAQASASLSQPLAGVGEALRLLPVPGTRPGARPWDWPHLLSGTRTSAGTGMVGLLSFTSSTTTVSVAEPTSGGVPLSVAVSTKLWAGTRTSEGWACG